MKIHDSNQSWRVRWLAAGRLPALLALTPFAPTRGKVFKLVPQ